MARLALTIAGRSGELDLLAGHYRFPRRHVKRLAEGLGDRALVYATARNAYLAMARLAAIEPDERDPGLLVARLANLQRFERLVPLPPAAEPSPTPRRTPLLWTLSEAEFDTIAAAGFPHGLHEEAGPFTHGFAEARQVDFDLEYTDSHTPEFARRVIDAYGGRCAFTGASEGYEDEDVDIVPIIPLEMGGPQRIGNFLPAARVPAAAFSAGSLTIGQRFEFITVLDRTNPEFFETFNPSGRLTLPADASARPDPEALDFHRRTLFNR